MEKKCKVWNAFQEDYNDNELQQRYDRFVENEKRLKKDYNDLVPVINEKIEKLHRMDHIIFESALLESVDKALLKERESLKAEIEEMNTSMLEVENRFKQEGELAKQYKKTADHRLFVWYKALKSVTHPEAKTYIDFKAKWGNRII